MTLYRLEEQHADIPTHTFFLNGQWRLLENMKAQYVSVNGIRKVACVVSVFSTTIKNSYPDNLEFNLIYPVLDFRNPNEYC